MTPMMLSLIAFGGVSSVIGLIAFMMRDTTQQTADRLDTLVGKKAKTDQGTEILKKTAFQNDKNSFLEMITPNFPSFHKIFEQADCHIHPSTLTGIGLCLAAVGGTVSWLMKVPWYLAPLAGIMVFFVPFLWVLNKRRARLKKFASPWSW
jgi:Flp pilus assembly protein TadB